MLIDTILQIFSEDYSKENGLVKDVVIGTHVLNVEAIVSVDTTNTAQATFALPNLKRAILTANVMGIKISAEAVYVHFNLDFERLNRHNKKERSNNS